MILTEPERQQAQRRELDAYCRDCGAGMAVTGRCYSCLSDRLVYVPHSAQTAAMLCRGGFWRPSD